MLKKLPNLNNTNITATYSKHILLTLKQEFGIQKTVFFTFLETENNTKKCKILNMFNNISSSWLNIRFKHPHFLFSPLHSAKSDQLFLKTNGHTFQRWWCFIYNKQRKFYTKMRNSEHSSIWMNIWSKTHVHYTVNTFNTMSCWYGNLTFPNLVFYLVHIRDSPRV